MTLIGFVWRDLLRNPRRTLAPLVGVVVGVGLPSPVLFFSAGSGASMTTRAMVAASVKLETGIRTATPPGSAVDAVARCLVASVEFIHDGRTVLSVKVKRGAWLSALIAKSRVKICAGFWTVGFAAPVRTHWTLTWT